MIWSLLIVIGYGRRDKMYCSLLSCYSPSCPATLLLVLPENSPWPPICPLFSYLGAFPWREPQCFLSLHPEWSIWKTDSVSTSLHHIQSFWSLFSPLPFSPSLHLPSKALTSCPPGLPLHACCPGCYLKHLHYTHSWPFSVLPLVCFLEFVL